MFGRGSQRELLKTKKILYLTTWDFSDGPSTGITNKIKAQIKALSTGQYQVDYTCIRYGGVWLISNEQEECLGKIGKTRKIGAYFYLLEKIREMGYMYVYNRYALMDTFYFHLLKSLYKNGSRIIIELPTYPYDREQLPGFAYWVLYSWDKLYRKHLYPYIYRITTYSEDQNIWKVKTLHIVNGIDFERVKMRKIASEWNDDIISIIGVAGLQKWHGYDRLIYGIAEYYRKGGKRQVIFHIVGDGPVSMYYKNIISQYHLASHVVMHGVKTGDELDTIYDECNIAVEMLAPQRRGIALSSSLKSREYFAKGLPFITAGEIDIMNDTQYIYHVEPVEDPIDMDEFIKYYDHVYCEHNLEKVSNKIRAMAIENCDICNTMKPVLECFTQERD